ncbi:hypothetical protein [Amycolatopsis sp. NPDC051371]|uniref:hypothetical protein n=1 Tax=Amycolatopsis sp. NPDC051371 TaxID=3155800 RepID=UPI0034249D90
MTVDGERSAAGLLGRRLSGVRYLVPAGASAAGEVEEGPVQEVAHGVVFAFEDGHVLFAQWQMDGEDEFLLLGSGDGGLLVDAVEVGELPEWRPLLGRKIVRVGTARHVPWEGRPLVLWALRIEFEGDLSVVVALGEIRQGVAAYLPTSVVVLFDADQARAYVVPSSETSAWGE